MGVFQLLVEHSHFIGCDTGQARFCCLFQRIHKLIHLPFHFSDDIPLVLTDCIQASILTLHTLHPSHIHRCG